MARTETMNSAATADHLQAVLAGNYKSKGASGIFVDSVDYQRCKPKNGRIYSAYAKRCQSPLAAYFHLSLRWKA